MTRPPEIADIPAFIRENRFQYRNGDPARLLCTDAPGNWPIRSMTRHGDVFWHRADGVRLDTDSEDFDLVELPEPAGDGPPDILYVGKWPNFDSGGKSLPWFMGYTETVANDRVEGGSAKCIRYALWPDGWSKPQPPRSEPSPAGLPGWNFCGPSKIRSKAMGAVAIASDGERSAIGATEQDAREAVESMQVAAVPTLPAGVPVPPEGFDYFGSGLVKGVIGSLTDDLAWLTLERDEWRLKAHGTLSGIHYAIRRGSELHRLNFREDGTPLP